VYQKCQIKINDTPLPTFIFTIPTKDNSFVLGEIYGHGHNLEDYEPRIFAGKNKVRYWIADVENPITVPNNITTRIKQYAQNDAWKTMAHIRSIARKNLFGNIIVNEVKYD
jgi:hypothetical protein